MENINQFKSQLLNQQQLCQNNQNFVQKTHSLMEHHYKIANDIDHNFSHHVNLKVKNILNHEISTVTNTSQRVDNLKTTTCDMTNVRHFASQDREIEVNISDVKDKIENPFRSAFDTKVSLNGPGIQDLPDPIITTTINDYPIYNILQNTQGISNNQNVESIIEQLEQATNTFNVYQNALEAFQILNQEKIRLCNNRKQNNHPEIQNRNFAEKIIQLRDAVENLEKEIVENKNKADELGIQIENNSKDTLNLNKGLKEAQTFFTNAYFNQLLEQKSKNINTTDLLLAVPNNPKVKDLIETHKVSGSARNLFAVLSFGLSIYTAYLFKTSNLAINHGIYQMLKDFCLSSFNTYILIAIAVTLIIAAISHLLHNKNKEDIINFAKNNVIENNN